MSANPQSVFRDSPSDIGSSSSFGRSAPAGGAAGDVEQRSGAGVRWELHMKLPQVVALWGIVALAMVLVFVFGFQAGRQQGLRLALEEHDVGVLRLPVDRSGLSAANTKSEQLVSLSLGEQKMAQNAAAAPNSTVVKDDLRPAVDVSATEAASTAPMSGFGSKAATQVIAASSAPSAQIVSPVPAAAKVATLGSKRLVTGVAAGPNEVSGSAEVVAKGSLDPAPSSSVESFSGVVSRASSVEGGERRAAAGSALEAETKKAEPKIETSRPASGWYLQVAASNSPSETAKLVAKLNQQQLPVVVQSATVRKTRYARILVGPFKAKNTAQEHRKKIKSLNLGKGNPFVRHLG